MTATTDILRVTRADVQPYTLALQQPLQTATGRFHHRLGFVLALQDERGAVGYGDAAPWPGFGSPHQQVMLQLGRLAHELLASEAQVHWQGQLHRQDAVVGAIAMPAAASPLLPEVQHALELALLDLLGQRRGLPVAELLAGAAAASSAQTQQLVGGDGPIEARAIKLKIGAASAERDRARLDDVLARAPQGAHVRLDANGAYDLAGARRALRQLARPGVVAFEQPLSPRCALADWVALRQQAAGKLVWPGAEAFLRVAQADPVQKLDHPAARLRSDDALMQRQALGDLLFDRVQRIQRGHRLLEDEADIVAANPHQFLGVGADHLGAGVFHRPADLGRVGQQADGGKRGQGLAGAGFADQRQRLALGDGQRDVLDGLDGFILGRKRDRQVLDRQQRLGHAGHRKVLRGSKASRTPSNTKTISDSMIAKVKNAVIARCGSCRYFLPCSASSPSDG